MKKLLETKLFKLLNGKHFGTNNSEMDLAYDEFIEKVKSIAQMESNYINVIRTLNHTRIELMTLDVSFMYEQGKKCIKISNKGYSFYRL